MALLRFLYYFGKVIAILVLLIIAIAFVVIVMNQAHAPKSGKPYLATHEAAGVYYSGPVATAIAGWYCIEYINATPIGGPQGEPVPTGYSIQLNAKLSNGAWVQNTMGPAQCVGSCISKYVWAYTSVFWVGNSTTGKGVTLPGPVACGWLVISIVNGTAYVGYSTDGRSVTWYGEYPVGGASIVPNPGTQLVLAGPCCNEGINITKALVYLALYYWNGTAWAPAPVGFSHGGTGEWVSKAWVLTGGRACGAVSWPQPMNETVCPGPPSFSPTPTLTPG